MRDDRKTKSELAGEVAHLRRRVAELEASDTGCKRTERELKVSDRALASSINAIAMADLEGNIAYVNPSFLDMWGYESESEVLGRPAAAFWESGEQARAIVEAVFEGRGWWGELTARRRDGSLFNVELSASMVTDEEGKPICMLGSFIDISARKQAERALQESQDRLRALIENAPDAIYLNDLNGKFIDGNKRAEEMVGYAREGLVGRSLFEAGVLPAEHLPKALESLQRNREGEASGPDEFELIRQDGSHVWVEITTFPVRRGEDVEVMGIARDVTERKQAEEALRESERRYRLLAENATDIIWTADMNLNPTYFSPSVERLRGYSVEEAMAQPIDRIYTPESVEVARQVLAEELAREQSGNRDRYRSRTLEMEAKRKDGTTFPVEVKVSFLRDGDGQPVGILGVSRDITDRKRSEELVRHIAYHDSLTGLPNRSLFTEVLNLELLRAQRNQRRVAVVFLDLDGFKEVNDSLGHSIGDQLLTRVARRLQHLVRKADTVARMGGDEFILVLPELHRPHDAATVALKIVEGLARPFAVAGERLHITASMGIALYPDDATGVDALMKQADIAMYRAKREGKNGYRFFDSGIGERPLPVS